MSNLFLVIYALIGIAIIVFVSHEIGFLKGLKQGTQICTDSWLETMDKCSSANLNAILKYLEKYEDTDAIKVKYIRRFINDIKKEDKNDQ